MPTFFSQFIGNAWQPKHVLDEKRGCVFEGFVVMKNMTHISIENLDFALVWMGWDAGSDLLSLILWIWPLSATLRSDSQRAQVQFGCEIQKSKYRVEKNIWKWMQTKAKPLLVLKRILFCRLRFVILGPRRKHPRCKWAISSMDVLISNCNYVIIMSLLSLQSYFLRSSTTMAGNIKLVWLQYTCRGRKLIHIQCMTTYLFH